MILLLGYNRPTPQTGQLIHKLAASLSTPVTIKFLLEEKLDLKEIDAVIAFGKAAANAVKEKKPLLEVPALSKLSTADAAEKKKVWAAIQNFAKEYSATTQKKVSLKGQFVDLSVGEGCDIEWQELYSILSFLELLGNPDRVQVTLKE